MTTLPNLLRCEGDRERLAEYLRADVSRLHAHRSLEFLGSDALGMFGYDGDDLIGQRLESLR